jgi:hypothetical protein
VNSLPRVTISLVISTVDTHPLATGHSPPFSISHPLSSYVFDAIHFFCRHHRTAAAVAKRNEPPRTLLSLAFTSTRIYVHIFCVRERKNYVQFNFFSLFCLLALWEYSIPYTQLLLILYGHFICDFLVRVFSIYFCAFFGVHKCTSRNIFSSIT